MSLAQWQGSASKYWPQGGYVKIGGKGKYTFSHETSLSEGLYVRVFEVGNRCSGTLLALKHYSASLAEQCNDDTRQHLCSEAGL